MNYGDYSLYEPKEMQQENKDIFKTIFDDFLADYEFNTELFPELLEEQGETLWLKNSKKI